MKNIIKSILLTGLVSVMCSSAFALKPKDSDVPAAVNSAFMAKYPQIQSKKWKMKNDTCVAFFKMDKRQYRAYFATNGTWIGSSRMMKHFANLPMNAQTFLKKGKYASWHIDEFEKMQTPTQTMYIVRIDNHSGSPVEYENFGDADNGSLYFNADGTLVKANNL